MMNPRNPIPELIMNQAVFLGFAFTLLVVPQVIAGAF